MENFSRKSYRNFRSDTIRLRDYDYSQNGCYFVTICTKDKSNCLGKVVDGNVILSHLGKILHKTWNDIP